MTQRERRLAIIAGGLFAVFVLQGAVRSLFLSRVEDLRQKIAARQREKARLLQFVSTERFLRDEWLRIYAMTLGADVSAARTRLDSMMKRLLEESGLTRYSARMLEPFTDRKRAGLVLLRYTVVTAECDLRSFVQFLHNFYRQPYAMRIVSFNLEPLSARRASVLKLTSLRVEAMLLPDSGAVPVDQIPATLPAVKPWRQIPQDLNAYSVLWTKKFMEPYEPPRVVHRPVQRPSRPVQTVKRDTTRTDTRVIGLVQYGSEAEVILLNDRTKQRQIIALDEPMDGGRLILVLPEAAVVEMPGGRKYVYWLGKTLAERELLSAAKHPEIFSAVKQLGGSG